MSSKSNFIARKVTPRWNPIKTALSLGHGRSLSVNKRFPSFDTDLWELTNKKEAWAKNPSVDSALDLLSGISTAPTSELADDVIKYLIMHQDKLSIPARLLLDRSINQSADTINGLILPKIEEYFSEKHLFAEINRLKTRLSSTPGNPIVWFNISHLYGQLGQFTQAEKAMRAALFLAPNNRLMIRSAAKMYQQIDSDSEKSLWVLRRAESIESDPWLISADIALSDSLGIKQKFRRKGLLLLKHSRIPDFHLSELRSAIGTNEIYSGSERLGKKHLDEALLCGTENSIAQIQWLQEAKILNNYPELNLDNIQASYEAASRLAYTNQKWDEVIDNAIKWVYYHPFSENAAMLAGYMLYHVLGDTKNAIEVTRIGQRANPKCLPLINNRIFFEAQNGNVDKAENIFNQISEGSKPNEKGLFHANAGMIKFKRGNIIQGRKEYLQAMEIFNKAGLSFEAQSAMLHWAYEEMKSGVNSTDMKRLTQDVLNETKLLDDTPLKKMKDELQSGIHKRHDHIPKKRSLLGRLFSRILPNHNS